MIWLFFCAVQVLLLINLNVNTNLPSSVISFIKQVAAIVNLEGVDKKKLLSYLRVPP